MSYERDRYTVLRHYADGTTRQVPEDEFFVLRKGDALAVGTLWNYLANVNLVLDIDSEHGIPLLGDHLAEHLEDLRDIVHEKVNDWQRHIGKIPD